MTDVSARFNITADDKTRAAFASVKASLNEIGRAAQGIKRSFDFGLRVAGIGTVMAALAKLPVAAKDAERLNDAFNNSDTKKSLEDLAKVVVDLKIGLVEDLDLMEKLLGLKRERNAFAEAMGAPGAIVKFDPALVANAQFADAQENLKKITDSLRTAEEKRNQELEKQVKLLNKIVAANAKKHPELADQAQADLTRIAKERQDMAKHAQALADEKSGRWAGLPESAITTNNLVFQAPELEAMKQAVERDKERQKIFEDTRTDAEKFQIEMAKLNDLFGNGTEDVGTYQRAVAKLQDEFEPLNKAVDAFTGSVEKAFGDMINTGNFSFRELGKNFLAEIAQGAIHDAMLELSKSLKSALSSSGGSGGSGFGSFLGSALGSLFGFASGGSFDVGGAGGTDSQLVAFRASPDERVTVSRPGQGGASIRMGDTYIDARGATADAIKLLPAVAKAASDNAVDRVRKLVKDGRL